MGIPRRRYHNGSYMISFYALVHPKQLLQDRNEKSQGLAATSDSLSPYKIWNATAHKRHTSTTTSLFPINNGMVLAWTGVIFSNPMLDTAVKIHSESSGVRASQAREAFEGGFFISHAYFSEEGLSGHII